jgi:hypothetical protein
MTDLRPEALLALADELEEQHTFSAFWSAVDDAVATLRAIAALPMAGEPVALKALRAVRKEFPSFKQWENADGESVEYLDGLLDAALAQHGDK